MKKKSLNISIFNNKDSSVVIGNVVNIDSLYIDELDTKEYAVRLGEYTYLESFPTSFYKLSSNKKKCFKISINRIDIKDSFAIELPYTFKNVEEKNDAPFDGYTTLWFPKSNKLLLIIKGNKITLYTSPIF
ncbi:MAG TPA: hypothetical protein PK649_02445 [Vicingus sp.]|nr:hypothetical protein [Vicingus sp.]